MIWPQVALSSQLWDCQWFATCKCFAKNVFAIGIAVFQLENPADHEMASELLLLLCLFLLL